MATAPRGGKDAQLRVETADELERDPVDPRDHIEERARLRHALELLSAVPERRRQIKALHVIGYKYDEIGELLGLSLTRVNQLIAEANAALTREQIRIGPDQQPRSPRAARLRELEEQPPNWLRVSIGLPPGLTTRAEAVLAWRRAALAIDDYRRATRRELTTTRSGIDPPTRALHGPSNWHRRRPSGPAPPAGSAADIRANAEWGELMAIRPKD